MSFRCVVKFLCIFFLFVVDGATRTNSFSTRYINDFNASSSFDRNYDDNIQRQVEKFPYQQEKAATKNDDENLEIIYPNPDDLRSRMHHEESVIKIYTTRVRQPKKDKTNRLNQTQSVDLNNDDLNGHDFIDSVMFIYYYGKNVRTWKDLGSNIVIIGAGFSIFAQILTIILVTLRSRRMRKNNAFFPITMNLLVMLFLSNLLFIVGVQSNKNALRCEMIALLLHYLYLTTAVWCFIFLFIIYDLIINESLRLKMRFILLMAYVGPAIYVMFSYAASFNSLEYQKYCFMSIHKNMIINFLVPIFILLVSTTTFGTICLKHIKDKNRDIMCESVDSSNGIVNGIGAGIIMNNGQNIERFITDKEILTSYYLKTSSFTNQLKCCEDQHEENYFKSKTDIYDSKFDLGQLSIDLSQSSSTDSTHDYTNFKNATKFALFFQPVFAICWFIGVLALENMQSYVFPTVFAICYNILNWSILLKSRNILPFMKHFYEIENCEATANEQCDEEIEEDQLARKDSKNMKNNKNLLNQLFLNSNTESSTILTGADAIHHRTDRIPLLYQTQFNHRKSIANLELTHTEYHFEKHKVNSRSEHDLVYQAKQQQQYDCLMANGNMENLISCMPGIRSSWDTNLDRVSTISN